MDVLVSVEAYEKEVALLLGSLEDLDVTRMEDLKVVREGEREG